MNLSIYLLFSFDDRNWAERWDQSDDIYESLVDE